MRRKVRIVMAAAFAALTSTLASAGELPDRPRFTAAELQEARQDANLSSLIDGDPWAVRQYFDKVEQADGTAVAQVAVADDDRTLPEAAWDLFQIMKRAGNPAPKPPPVKK